MYFDLNPLMKGTEIEIKFNIINEATYHYIVNGGEGDSINFIEVNDKFVTEEFEIHNVLEYTITDHQTYSSCNFNFKNDNSIKGNVITKSKLN